MFNNKIKAYEFIDSLGFKRPQIISPAARMESISFQEKIVIKPYNGYSSRGVCLVFNEHYIHKVRSGEVLERWQALKDAMRKDLISGAVRHDHWIVEELVLKGGEELKPARDLKFYCFYGRAVLVLEIVCFPKTTYCFWKRDMTKAVAGAYLDRLFSGVGFTPRMLEIAETTSLQTPSPFMRIDFHSTGSGIVFCEFTPRPGGAWLYNKKFDQIMGDSYLAAEGSLLNNFLPGKLFEAFNTL